MTLTIHLPPEKEAALNAAAQAQGISAESWLQDLVEKRLDGSSEAAPVPTQRPPLSARIREI